jgi:hypothetical protein
MVRKASLDTINNGDAIRELRLLPGNVEFAASAWNLGLRFEAKPARSGFASARATYRRYSATASS